MTPPAIRYDFDSTVRLVYLTACRLFVYVYGIYGYLIMLGYALMLSSSVIGFIM